MLSEINYEKLPSFELGMTKGIKGIYIFEQNPSKIAQILEVDEKLVKQILQTIK